VRWERWVEARYRGQSHELPLPWVQNLAARFHRAHERRFGFADPSGTVEVVTLEVRGALADERVLHGRAAEREATTPATRAMAVHAGRRVRATLHAHPTRRAWRGRGPAFVLQDGATLWIPPGWRAKTGGGGAVIVERGA
jgi:N-methylhydantoinase A